VCVCVCVYVRARTTLHEHFNHAWMATKLTNLRVLCSKVQAEKPKCYNYIPLII
jgi:hypothetical protein